MQAHILYIYYDDLIRYKYVSDTDTFLDINIFSFQSVKDTCYIIISVDQSIYITFIS